LAGKVTDLGQDKVLAQRAEEVLGRRVEIVLASRVDEVLVRQVVKEPSKKFVPKIKTIPFPYARHSLTCFAGRICCANADRR
jgi:hypothetical protein